MQVSKVKRREQKDKEAMPNISICVAEAEDEVGGGKKVMRYNL